MWIELYRARKQLNLKWNTRFRGEFLVDAFKTIDKEVRKLYNIDVSSLIIGPILGNAVPYDVNYIKVRMSLS